MKIWLNCKDNHVTYTKKNYLLAAANRLGLVGEHEISFHNHCQMKDVDYDYILNIEPFVHFIKGNIWTGIWEIDLVIDRRETSPSNWHAADTVFIANSTLPKHFLPHQHLCQLLFQACDPHLHRTLPEIKPEFDFVFSGSMGSDFYQRRSESLNALIQKFSFKDFGKDHKPSKYVEYLNKARVQFVQSGCNENAPDGYIAQRFFECLAIGPVLTNYHSDLELLGLVENVDYMVFRSEIDLMVKMDLLLKDYKLRNRIKQSGRKKALLLHTYENRLISIINAVSEDIYLKRKR